MNLRRSLAATLVLCSLVLLVVGSAGAVPKPPPKFWSPARGERVLPPQFRAGAGGDTANDPA